MNQLIAIILICTSVFYETTQAPDPDRADAGCGPQTLYMLLRLQDRAVSMHEVRRALGPGRGAHGHSLGGLAKGSAGFGIPLDAVRLPRNERTITTAAIAFLKRNGVGHYVIVRPAGHSGTLIQVVDPADGQPAVVDYRDLVELPGWTGFALVPKSHDGQAIRVALSILLCVLGITLIASGVARCKRPQAGIGTSGSRRSTKTSCPPKARPRTEDGARATRDSPPN